MVRNAHGAGSTAQWPPGTWRGRPLVQDRYQGPFLFPSMSATPGRCRKERSLVPQHVDGQYRRTSKDTRPEPEHCESSGMTITV
jgi:hypothetical protein